MSTAMTEDEAKTKWCPMVVASHTDPRVRTDQNGYMAKGDATDKWFHACIGSACMGWRADPDQPTHQPIGSGNPLPIGEPRGYCGFAGKL